MEEKESVKKICILYTYFDVTINKNLYRVFEKEYIKDETYLGIVNMFKNIEYYKVEKIIKDVYKMNESETNFYNDWIEKRKNNFMGE